MEESALEAGEGVTGEQSHHQDNSGDLTIHTLPLGQTKKVAPPTKGRSHMHSKQMTTTNHPILAKRRCLMTSQQALICLMLP
jgi:hypothetical protein